MKYARALEHDLVLSLILKLAQYAWNTLKLWNMNVYFLCHIRYFVGTHFIWPFFSFLCHSVLVTRTRYAVLNMGENVWPMKT